MRKDSKQSWKKAFEWYTKAVNKLGTQINLGRIYQFGLGLAQDYDEAMKWYKKAEANGSREATALISTLYHYGQGVPVNLTEALNMYHKAGDCGAALNGKGLLYQNGLGVTQNYDTAMSYFEQATQFEYGDAFNSMGDVYRYGYDKVVDLDTAFLYYTKSAECTEHTSNKGQFNLGLMYLNGLGIEVNQNLALFWLRKSAKYGNEKADEYIDRIVTSLVQLTPVSHSKENIQLIIQESRLKDMQIQSMEDRIASLIAENEILKRKGKIENTSFDDEVPKSGRESRKFFEVLELEEKKTSMKFFHV